MSDVKGIVLLYQPNIRLRAASEVNLRRIGYDVVGAESEETALSLGRANSPELALLACETAVRGDPVLHRHAGTGSPQSGQAFGDPPTA